MLRALFLLMAGSQTSAQDITKDTLSGVFTLGEVTITGFRTNPSNNVSADKIRKYNKTDVSSSLNLLPGITLSGVGGRNESTVFVRGFDLRQVPVYMDGIPVYVPYDGYVDLARFTVFDLSAVQVEKGYSSVLYGPNAMGGAINLISRKPRKKIEINAGAALLSGGFRSDINLGSNLGKFYWQASASKLKRDYFPLSKSFVANKNEDGGRRENSYNNDEKISAKIGYTPKAGQEFVLGYVYQKGEKGNPLYAGTDILNSQLNRPRYWQWPAWDKQSVYAISNTEINDNNGVKVRLFYDQFKNRLNSFDDATYSTMKKPSAFKSNYNDFTFGGSAQLTNNSIKNNTASFAFHFKQDVHREFNDGEPERKLSDNNISLALEDDYKISDQLRVNAGISLNRRTSLITEGYDSKANTIFNYENNNNTSWNLQSALIYNFTKNGILNLSVAKKTRFATMKDRYSFRLGTAIPNPDLNAESTVNYEVGYNDKLSSQLKFHSALFYSHITNTIQMVNNVQKDPITGKFLAQQQNTGTSEYLGGELGLDYTPINSLAFSANYTYIRRNNLDSSEIKFTDVPLHKIFLSAQYQALPALYFLASSEFNSSRYSTSYGTEAKDFLVANFKANYNIYKFFSLEAGVNNVFDRNYQLVEGYPEAGRNFMLGILFNY